MLRSEKDTYLMHKTGCSIFYRFVSFAFTATLVISIEFLDQHCAE